MLAEAMSNGGMLAAALTVSVAVTVAVCRIVPRLWGSKPPSVSPDFDECRKHGEEIASLKAKQSANNNSLNQRIDDGFRDMGRRLDRVEGLIINGRSK